jgi:hypothetical protein
MRRLAGLPTDIANLLMPDLYIADVVRGDDVRRQLAPIDLDHEPAIPLADPRTGKIAVVLEPLDELSLRSSHVLDFGFIHAAGLR